MGPTCIRLVPGSNLSKGTNYHDFFLAFLSSYRQQENSALIRPRSLLFPYFQIHNHLTIRSSILTVTDHNINVDLGEILVCCEGWTWMTQAHVKWRED
jgi:hypothetical protein